jgi:methionine S-methyltransferase
MHSSLSVLLQAADTDISALVEIEKNSPHRFEFFMGLSGDQPICARTAWAYGKAGGRISHALSVYSCQLRQPNQVLTLVCLYFNKRKFIAQYGEGQS